MPPASQYVHAGGVPANNAGKPDIGCAGTEVGKSHGGAQARAAQFPQRLNLSLAGVAVGWLTADTLSLVSKTVSNTLRVTLC
jgi:hypothetical protein